METRLSAASHTLEGMDRRKLPCTRLPAATPMDTIRLVIKSAVTCTTPFSTHAVMVKKVKAVMRRMYFLRCRQPVDTSRPEDVGNRVQGSFRDNGSTRQVMVGGTTDRCDTRRALPPPSTRGQTLRDQAAHGPGGRPVVAQTSSNLPSKSRCSCSPTSKSASM